MDPMFTEAFPALIILAVCLLFKIAHKRAEVTATKKKSFINFKTDTL